MNPKTSLLYYPVESLDIIIQNGNVFSDYFPALDSSTDAEGNEMGVPSLDLSLLNRIQNHYLSDNPHKWTKEQCQQRITQRYDYIGDDPDLQGKKFYQISMVMINYKIKDWVATIKEMRDVRAASRGPFSEPEEFLISEIDWSTDFIHTDG